MIRSAWFTCCVLLLLLTNISSAAVVADQEQLSFNDQHAFVLADSAIIQSIIPNYDNIVSVKVGVNNATSVNVGIFDSNANGSTAIEFGTTATVSGGFAEVVFPNPVQVTPGVTYFIVADGTGTGGIRFQASESYPLGSIRTGFSFIHGGTGLYTLSSQTGDFPAFDMQFQTFSEDAVTAVPEPGAGAILLATTMACIIRRRTR